MKDFLKFWQPNTKITTYWLPVIKILLGAVVVLIIFFRNELFPALSALKKAELLDKFFYLIIWLIFLVFCISVAEIYQLHRRKKLASSGKKSTTLPQSVDLKLDIIQSLLEKNEIIDFLAQIEARTIHFGASSDYYAQHYTDKRYYIDSKEYTNIQSFLIELGKLTDKSGCIQILMVDDMAAWKYLR